MAASSFPSVLSELQKALNKKKKERNQIKSNHYEDLHLDLSFIYGKETVRPLREHDFLLMKVMGYEPNIPARESREHCQGQSGHPWGGNLISSPAKDLSGKLTP